MKTKILNNCNDQVSGDDDILIALRLMDFGIRTNFVRRRRDLDIVVFGNLLIAVFLVKGHFGLNWLKFKWVRNFKIWRSSELRLQMWVDNRLNFSVLTKTSPEMVEKEFETYKTRLQNWTVLISWRLWTRKLAWNCRRINFLTA